MSTENDRVLASIGLPRHRRPGALADHLERLAALLRSVDIDQAIRIAPIFGARGWPSGTLGDGGSSTGASIIVTDDDTGPDGERVPVTSTEAAAFQHSRFDNADWELAAALAVIDEATRKLDGPTGSAVGLSGDLLAHASDVDEVPAGTGACEACSKVCRPTAKDPDNRLRAGLCDPCRKHFARSGIADRGEWLLVRRAMVGHKESADEMASRFQRTYGDLAS